MGDFVSAAQLATFLQADVDTASANLAITSAEALVRSYCRQTLSESTSTGAELPVVLTESGWVVDLPERPVSALSALGVNGTVLVEGTDFQRSGCRVWLAEVPSSPDEFAPVDVATVTYSHGYASGSPDFETIQGVVLSLAGRVYDNPRGMRSESVEGYTYTRGGSGDDILGVSLSESERMALGKYRRTAGTVTVA